MDPTETVHLMDWKPTYRCNKRHPKKSIQ